MADVFQDIGALTKESYSDPKKTQKVRKPYKPRLKKIEDYFKQLKPKAPSDGV